MESEHVQEITSEIIGEREREHNTRKNIQNVREGELEIEWIPSFHLFFLKNPIIKLVAFF